MSHQPEQHTAECQVATVRFLEEHQAFLTQWPDCCRLCHATGSIWDIDADEDDICEECLGADRCPRCHGDFHYQDANSRCPSCGWEMFEECLPFPPECDCDGTLKRILEGDD